MRKSLMKIFAALAMLVLFLNATTASAKAPSPAAGSYPCYTYQISQQLHERQRASTATLETDWRMVYERSTDIVPAGISISLDGKNGYSVVGTRARGTYSYNAGTGQVTFAGEASELKLRSYFVKNGLYILQFQPNPDVFYHCEYNSGNREIGATGGDQTQTGAAQQNSQSPNPMRPRSAAPLKASDLTGRFEGSYVCGQGETRLSLDLQVNSEGVLAGTFAFGGTNNVPNGSFAMNGLWSAQSFMLNADHWIQQPDGYSMVNINGYLADGGGLSGEIVAQGCTGFNVIRK